MRKEFSTFLDMSRWLAAFFVVIGHVRHLVLADFGEVVHKNIFIKALYFVTGFGHEAVMVFFVLSGLLVGGITLKKWEKTGVNFADYFAHRISRIYTVLLPALVVGYGLDYLGFTFFNASELYTNAAKFATNSLKVNIFNNLSVTAFLGNLLMLESTYVPVLGSNGPLWSLAYEWWYYCIFAVCAGAVLLKSTRTMMVCFVLLIIIVVFSPLHLLVWMSIWLLGVVTLFYCESSLPKPPALLSSVLFVAALVLSRLNTHNISTLDSPEPMYVSFLYDFAIGVSYSLLLAAFYNYEGKILPFRALHRKLADFSYSLYLVHCPMLLIIVATLHDVFAVKFLGHPDSWYILYFLAVTGVLYVYSFLFSLVTEKYTVRVKAMVARWLGIKDS